MKENQTLDISWSTILKMGIGGLFFYIIFLVRHILTWLLFSLIISILLEPAIEFLEKRKVPRTFAVILIYVLLFFLIGFLIYFISLPLVNEVQKILLFLPQYFEKIIPLLKNLKIEDLGNLEIFIKNFKDWLLSASGGILNALSNIFGGILTAFTIFTFSIFISFEKKGVERLIKAVFPAEKVNFILEIWQKCQVKVSGWFGIKVLGCVLVGVTTFVSLKILKIDYPLLLGVLAGITNIVPILGPIFAGAIITIFAFFNSFTIAVITLIVFILIQQIEGNLLTPALSKKFMGMPSILVLVSLLVGGKLWGMLGAILAVPIFGIVFEFLKDLLPKQEQTT